MSDVTRSLHGRLETSGEAIRSLIRKVDRREAEWKPDAGRWSILEVVNHLADEEVEDFRMRLEIILNRPEETFPSIDPQGWVTSRSYASRDLAESLGRFAKERENSLRWIASLDPVNVDREKLPPSGVALTAPQLMSAWAAHDLLHIRQLTRLRYDYLAWEVAPLSIDYAGRW